jgi:hypothetical protein
VYECARWYPSPTFAQQGCRCSCFPVCIANPVNAQKGRGWCEFLTTLEPFWGLPEGRGFTGCGKTAKTVILRSRRRSRVKRRKDLRICLILQMQRFFAQFTLSEIPRSFASLRMTANGLRMTAGKRFSAASSAPPLQDLPEHFRVSRRGPLQAGRSVREGNYSPAEGGRTSGALSQKFVDEVSPRSGRKNVAHGVSRG